MTENEVIQQLFQSFELKHQAHGFGKFGDDAVVIPQASAQDHLVLSTDSYSDGTHFDSTIESSSVGWKSLVGAMSDIVAMGAQPSFFMLNLILPSDFKAHKELFSGLLKASKEYKVSLLGGDVSKGKSLTLSITVGGFQPKSRLKANHGAKEGDIVYVSDPLGEALLGFEEHKRGVRSPEFVQKFLYPNTPVHLGSWLSEKEYVSTLRDVSDGLLAELRQFSSTNKLSIKLDKLKHNKEFLHVCTSLELIPDEMVLKGGEDYCLLWTVKKDFQEQFEKEYLKDQKKSPIKIGEVLKLNNGSSVIYEPNQSLTDSIMPFEHFSS